MYMGLIKVRKVDVEIRKKVIKATMTFGSDTQYESLFRSLSKSEDPLLQSLYRMLVKADACAEDADTYNGVRRGSCYFNEV